MHNNVNHGIINELYYKGTSRKETIKIHGNAYIELIQNYFIHFQGRDKYYVAMKYKAETILRQAGFGFQEIANMMGMENHSSVVHLLRNYKPLPDYEDFIRENFLQLMYDQEYPITPKKHLKINREYTLIKKEELWKIIEERKGEHSVSQEEN